MIEILVYAIGIMYTPGPCNLLSLNAGLKGQIYTTIRFGVGMSCATLMLFVLFGYTGTWLLTPDYQFLISCTGCLYIAYLAVKLIRSCSVESAKLPDQNPPTSYPPVSYPPQESTEQQRSKNQNNQQHTPNTSGTLSFKTGMVMQLLNPKAFIAILPIVTVQFPAAEVTGEAIFLWSLLLSSIMLGAPCAYMLMGAKLGRLISSPSYFRALNVSMSLLLFYVAGDIAYSHVFLKIA